MKTIVQTKGLPANFATSTVGNHTDTTHVLACLIMKGSDVFSQSGVCHLVTIHPPICAHFQTRLHRGRRPGCHGTAGHLCCLATVGCQGYRRAIAAFAINKGRQAA